MLRVTNALKKFRPAFDRITIIILAAFLIAGSVAGFGAYSFARGFFSTTAVINVGNLPPIVSNQQSATADPSKPEATEAIKAYSPEGMDTSVPMPEPWNGTSPVTVLFMGLDYRDWSEGVDIPRTDTMILFSIDPLNKTAGMLSIPRDMWVNVPGFGYGRINTAYRLGEANKLPGGGTALAMKTVEHFLGVPVNYSVQLDFMAFVRFIDELGGLDMHIREEIIVDPIGPGNTVTIYPGVQALDGATVLAYARMRYTQDGDFDRSKRQQEVIMALREQILTFNMVPMLLSKAPKLYAELSSGIHTTLTFDQMIQLGMLALQVEEQNIKKGVFDPHKDVNYGSVDSSEGRQDVLIPNPDQIRLLRDQIFANGGPYAPAAVSDSAELMKLEQARVVVNNGTLTAGLATQASERLRAQGVNVMGEGNAAQATSATTIVDYSGNPYTIKLIVEALGLPQARVLNKFDPAAPQDIEVIIGSDWNPQQ